MTDDTQDQRLTYEQAYDATEEARARYEQANWDVSGDEHIAFVHGYIEGVAARSVRDDPTLRERIEALAEEWERWSDGSPDNSDALAARHLRAVLAEHAPTDDPSAAGEHVRARFATPDDQREPGDPVRHASGYVPCGREHDPGRVCLLPDRHNRLAATPEDGAR